LPNDRFGANEIAAQHILETSATNKQFELPYTSNEFNRIYKAYELAREEEKVYGYDDMQLWALMVLLHDAGLRESLQKRYSCIIVDECQDTNLIQLNMAKVLVGLKPSLSVPRHMIVEETNQQHNLMLVGDISQSLYKFRGATPNEFLEFAKDKHVKILRLQNNYRSAAGICDIATHLVAGKAWHLGGKLVPKASSQSKEARTVEGSELAPQPPSVKTVIYEDVMSEISHVLKQATTGLAQGGKLTNYALLSRMTVYLQIAELECVRQRIPYIKRGGTKTLFDSDVFQDIMAYVYLLAGEDPSGRFFARVINAPNRFIPGAKVKEKVAEATRAGVTFARGPNNMWWDKALTKLHGVMQYGKQGQAIVGLQKTLLTAHRAAIGGITPLSAIMSRIIQDTNYLQSNTDKTEAQGGDSGIWETKREVINLLLAMAAKFTNIVEFSQYMVKQELMLREGAKVLKQKDGDKKDHLTLTTIHSAKGKEWDHVFIVNVAEKVFPSQRNPDQDEELRLLYVAITRAKKSCEVSYSREFERSEFFAKVYYLTQIADIGKKQIQPPSQPSQPNS
jgi:DNA helicase-2/ATP-dependent DNA helicase PcrA